eukprot:CAMPEP_0113510050 /NCGR_PEP_ID=MMETSP0014_2-20120614/37915_1 /TAXON_ID=2857 /ORGANISM="Nitzschia sp." /LENGTH=124 /DNA_ID=CAMNT_0000405947 /DNA_START=1209 /DNA_END=1583 /DNA_ORIENTATION=- /assembly_acc=CAM_ASM_000159
MPLYEEVEIEDFSYDPQTGEYTYPCPCGDIFKVTLEELWDGEDIARCPSCTLFVQVIYDEEDLPELAEDDDDDDEDDDGGVDNENKTETEQDAPMEEDDKAVKADGMTSITNEMTKKLNISSSQ